MGRRARLGTALAALVLAAPLPGGAGALPDLRDPAWLAPALALSREIQALHLLPDTVVDPIFEAPGQGNIVGYTHYGDSAIWTGHYLAAEMFRYALTGEPEALANAARVLGGIHRQLNIAEGWQATVQGVAVKGQAGLLLRYCQPAERPPGLGDDVVVLPWQGRDWLCLDDVSRDQYMGVVLGLGAALRFLPEGPLKARAGQDAAGIARFLLAHGWNVAHPNGHVSTTFAHRPDMTLAILRLASKADASLLPAYEAHAAALAPMVAWPEYSETFAVGTSYYKFNLDHAAVYTLASLEDEPARRAQYLQALDVLQKALGDHSNAHFDAVAFALTGQRALAAQAIDSLGDWLQRPRPMHPVDYRGLCGASIPCVPEEYGEMTLGKEPAVKLRWNPGPCEPLRALHPLPVGMRAYTDFLWQRSPFKLEGGDDPRVLNPGIDYLLPYWMLRYHLEEAPAPSAAMNPWPLPVPHPGGAAVVEAPPTCLPAALPDL